MAATTTTRSGPVVAVLDRPKEATHSHKIWTEPPGLDTMSDEMTVAASVALLIRRELDEDYVGLWKLPWHIRRALPDASDTQVQHIASSVLESLTRADVVLGDLDERSGVFLPWPTTGAAEKAITAWRTLGRDPNIGEGAWLATAE